MLLLCISINVLPTIILGERVNNDDYHNHQKLAVSPNIVGPIALMLIIILGHSPSAIIVA
jgi:hypothetical protein